MIHNFNREWCITPLTLSESYTSGSINIEEILKEYNNIYAILLKVDLDVFVEKELNKGLRKDIEQLEKELNDASNNAK